MSVILVTGGFDQKIRFWEATSGVCTKSIRFGDSQVNKLQISRDKLLVAAGGNPQIQLYDTNSNNDHSIQSLDGHTQNVTDLGFQTDGKWIYSCSEDGQIKVWDIRTPTCSVTIDSRCALNTTALHSNEVDLITGDQNGCIKVWDLRTTLCRFEHTPLSEVPVRSLSLSQDSSLLAVGSHKGKVFLYRPSNSRGKEWLLDSQFHAHDNYLLKCLISPDHCTIATTSADHTIKLWKYLPSHSPSSSSGIDSTLSSHQQQQGGGGSGGGAGSNVSLTRCLTSHQRWVWDAVFSADSSYMVSASSDSTAKLWDIRTGDIIRNYLGHTLSVCSVALNDNNI